MKPMTTDQKIAWYEAEIKDARKWLAYFEDRHLPTCASIERVRLRRLQQELEAINKQKETP